MKIDRVRLTNYGPHESLDLQVDSDFVGIVGDNGSGKSNLILSISDAVTGDFHKKKTKLITHGHKNGSIEIDGRIANRPVNIFRALSGTECHMEYDGETTDGADKVNQRMIDLLGCDKSFLSNMVFVRQTDILGLLFGRPAERNRLLQKFFGLEKATKLETSIGQWISNLNYPPLIDEELAQKSIEDINASIKENEAELKRLTEELEELNDEQITEEEYQKLSERLAQSRKYEISVDRVKDLEATLEQDKRKLSELRPPGVTKDELDKLNVLIEEYDWEIASTDRIIRILEGAVEMGRHENCVNCPLCESELNAEKVKAFADQLEKEEKKSHRLKEDRRKVKGQQSAASEALSEYKTSVKGLDTTISWCEQQIGQQRQIQSMGAPKHTSDAYQAAIDRSNKLGVMISSKETEIEQVKKTIGDLCGQRLRHENSIKQAQRTKRIYEGTKMHAGRIARVRDVFRHNGRSTEQFINAKMKQMQESINQYLVGFGAPYRARVQSDNEIACVFGSKTMDAEELSCGQKVILSLAFRFASCELFVSGVNMIFLDEPTTWLDRTRIENFPVVLDALREISVSKGLQVFTVTHERSLIPHFDQVIEF